MTSAQNLLFGATLCVVSLSAALARRSSPPLDVYFAPYDSVTPPLGFECNATSLEFDLCLIAQVTAAAKKGGVPCQMVTDECPYQIRFAVYNLLDLPYIDPLIEAAKAGAGVQVLIDEGNMLQPYVHTYEMFKAAGLRVTDNKNTTQLNLTDDAQKRELNLLGIQSGGLMHAKTRYFKWGEEKMVVSGSLNPETAASLNDDTLLVVRDRKTVERYVEIYDGILDISTARVNNSYDPSKAMNVLYSKAWVHSDVPREQQLVRDVIVDLASAEKEMILVSVYSLRNIEDTKRRTLIDALCKAHQRGVAVAVITDKGQSDGEGTFSTGDNTLTALRLMQCGIIVYKAKNYDSQYAAFHHKNAMFGLTGGVQIVTDTANWSGSSMGNGTTFYRPYNSETTMVINPGVLEQQSGSANSGVPALALRFLSNFLASLRAYAYQQHCPYSFNHTLVRANCAFNSTPAWVQPNSSQVLTKLQNLVGSSWPTVAVSLVLKLPAAATSVECTISSLSEKPQSVPMTIDGMQAKSKQPVNVQFGTELQVDVAVDAAPQGSFELVVDNTFDWASNVRLSDESIHEMKLVVEHEL